MKRRLPPTSTSGGLSASAKRQVMQRLEEIVDLLLRACGPDEWVDQNSSPLGRREHLEAARRGDVAGYKIGRRILVRRSEIDEFIRSFPVNAQNRDRTPLAPSPGPMDDGSDDDVVVALERRLGLVHVKGRKR